MKKKLIPNKDLVLEKIPSPEDKSFEYEEPWQEFALTINAYEVCGNSEAAFETRNKVFKDPLNASLTELRCALFVLQRHHRWNSPYPVPGEDERIKQLLQLIRNKVEKKEFE
jgi:hypothetical protein